MEIIQAILLVLFVIMSFLLVLVILLQDDQGEGMAGLFAGSSSSTFGSRAGNILTKTTSILGSLFMILAVVLAFLFKTPNTGDVSAAAREAEMSQEWWNEPVDSTNAKDESTNSSSSLESLEQSQSNNEKQKISQ